MWAVSTHPAKRDAAALASALAAAGLLVYAAAGSTDDGSGLPLLACQFGGFGGTPPVSSVSSPPTPTPLLCILAPARLLLHSLAHPACALLVGLLAPASGRKRRALRCACLLALPACLFALAERIARPEHVALRCATAAAACACSAGVLCALRALFCLAAESIAPSSRPPLDTLWRVTAAAWAAPVVLRALCLAAGSSAWASEAAATSLDIATFVGYTLFLQAVSFEHADARVRARVAERSVPPGAWSRSNSFGSDR